MRVAVLIILAALLRLPSLLNDGLWRDQANVYVQITAPSFGTWFERTIATEWHPPLYFLLSYYWNHIAGTSELALTILPYVFSIAMVAAVYFLGREVHSKNAGLVAAFICAIAPVEISQATEYVYPLAGLLFTLLAITVVRARAVENRTNIAAVAVTSALCVYTHYMALMYVLLLCFWCARRLRIVAALAAGIVSFLPWVPAFLRQRAIGVPYAQASTLLVKFAVALANTMGMFPVEGLIPTSIAFAALVVALLILSRRRPWRDAYAMGALLGVIISCATLANLTEIRYVLTAYSLFCVFLGAVLADLVNSIDLPQSRTSRVLAAGAVAAIASLLLAGGAQYAFEASATPKSGLRTLAQSGALDRRSFYLVAPDYLASTFAYYDRSSKVSFTGFARMREPQVFRLRGYARDWKAQSVEAAVRSIELSAAQYRYLDILVDTSARNMGQVPYGKVWSLLRKLAVRHMFLRRITYAGRAEPIADYRFVAQTLRPTGCRHDAQRRACVNVRFLTRSRITCHRWEHA